MNLFELSELDLGPSHSVSRCGMAFDHFPDNLHLFMGNKPSNRETARFLTCHVPLPAHLDEAALWLVNTFLFTSIVPLGLDPNQVGGGQRHSLL